MLETIERTALHTLTRYTYAYQVLAAALADPADARAFPTSVTWAAVFDVEDLAAFTGALKRALLAAADTGDTGRLESTVAGWRALARVITHPQAEPIVIGLGTASFYRFVDTDSAVAAW